MATEKKSGAYEVGKGKPPKHGQFKPGQSGNPGGRPKGSLNLATVVRKVAKRTVRLKSDGENRPVAIPEAMMLGLVQSGLKGNVRAIISVLDYFERHSDREETSGAISEAGDEAIIGRALERGLAARQATTPKRVAKTESATKAKTAGKRGDADEQ